MKKSQNFSDSKLSNKKATIRSLSSSNDISYEPRQEKDEERGSISSSRESFKLSSSSKEKQSSNFINKINPKFVYKDSARSHIMPKIIEEFTETTAPTIKRPKKKLKLKLNKKSIQSQPYYPKSAQKASSLSPNRPDQMNFNGEEFKNLLVEKKTVEPDVKILDKLKECWDISKNFSDFQILNFLENYSNFPELKNLEKVRKDHLEDQLEILNNFLVKKKICPNLPKKLNFSEMKRLERSDYSNRGMKFLINTSKKSHTSSFFQKYLKITPEENIEEIQEKLEPECYALSFNKFSNYIVQILIERSETFREKFLEICIKNFENMITNEYASRVLQKFILVGEEKIEQMAVKFLTFNPDFFLSNVSSVILLKKLIITTKNEEILGAIKTFFKNVIIMNPLLVQTERHMIRILMNLFSVMDNNEISMIFFYLKDFIGYLAHHKFGMYVLQKVIEKEVKPFDLMIKSFLVQNYSLLFGEKTAKYVIFRALEFDFQKMGGGFFALEVLKGIVVDRYMLERITYGKENMSMFLAALFGVKGKEFSHTLVVVVNTLLKIVSEGNKKLQCKNLLFI